MFSQQPKDVQSETKTKLQDPILPTSSSPMAKVETSVKQAELELNKPEIVTIVEKLSAILSPYFIVLVGLYLYDNGSLFSFLFGTILIMTGVLSILKISGDDFNNFFNGVKKTLGYDNEEDRDI